MKVDDEFLTPAEVARLFRVDPKTVSRWASAGKIDSVRTLGGHRRFRTSDVRRLLFDASDEGASDPREPSMKIECENCGEQVRVQEGGEPVRCEVRDSDKCGPPTFLIIDGGWLVHRCTILTTPEGTTTPEKTQPQPDRPASTRGR